MNSRPERRDLLSSGAGRRLSSLKGLGPERISYPALTRWAKLFHLAFARLVCARSIFVDEPAQVVAVACGTEIGPSARGRFGTTQSRALIRGCHRQHFAASQTFINPRALRSCFVNFAEIAIPRRRSGIHPCIAIQPIALPKSVKRAYLSSEGLFTILMPSRESCPSFVVPGASYRDCGAFLCQPFAYQMVSSQRAPKCQFGKGLSAGPNSYAPSF